MSGVGQASRPTSKQFRRGNFLCQSARISYTPRQPQCWLTPARDYKYEATLGACMAIDRFELIDVENDSLWFSAIGALMKGQPSDQNELLKSCNIYRVTSYAYYDSNAYRMRANSPYIKQVYISASSSTGFGESIIAQKVGTTHQPLTLVPERM